jgi:AcrR family transcriptional regulator
MIDREFERRIQDVLDGLATPAEAEQLKAWLARSEEGRTRLRELEGLFATLDRVPFAEMPNGLATEIEQAIRARAALQPQGRTQPARMPANRMRLAMVFAAGIAAGVIGWGALTGILNPGSLGHERVVGTMMPQSPPRAGTVQRTWSSGGTRYEAVVWRVGKSRWLRLSVHGRSPSEVELRFDPTALSPAAVRQSDPPASVVLEPGRILIRVTRRGEFTLEFGEQSASGAIEVIARAGNGSVSGQLPTP